MLDVLAELDAEDSEHPDVALVHESGWALSAYGSGLLVLENVEGDEEPKHMRNVARPEVAELWSLLATGDLQALESRQWLPGYGSA